MSDDRRERILVRLREVLAEQASGQDPAVGVHRDRAELEENELPAYVLLDGGEEQVTDTSDRRGPALMRMTPQVFYVPLPPLDTTESAGIGARMSEHRARLIRAIKSDGELLDLVGANGWIEYRAMESDMQTGGEVQGQFRLDFAVAYMLNFRNL